MLHPGFHINVSLKGFRSVNGRFCGIDKILNAIVLATLPLSIDLVIIGGTLVYLEFFGK